MSVQSTSRGHIARRNDTTHTAYVTSGEYTGETYTCACARRADHGVTGAELTGGSWQDTHPVLF